MLLFSMKLPSHQNAVSHYGFIGERATISGVQWKPRYIYLYVCMCVCIVFSMVHSHARVLITLTEHISVHGLCSVLVSVCRNLSNKENDYLNCSSGRLQKKRNGTRFPP